MDIVHFAKLTLMDIMRFENNENFVYQLDRVITRFDKGGMHVSFAITTKKLKT